MPFILSSSFRKIRKLVVQTFGKSAKPPRVMYGVDGDDADFQQMSEESHRLERTISIVSKNTQNMDRVDRWKVIDSLTHQQS